MCIETDNTSCSILPAESFPCTICKHAKQNNIQIDAALHELAMHNTWNIIAKHLTAAGHSMDEFMEQMTECRANFLSTLYHGELEVVRHKRALRHATKKYNAKYRFVDPVGCAVSILRHSELGTSVAVLKAKYAGNGSSTRWRNILKELTSLWHHIRSPCFHTAEENVQFGSSLPLTLGYEHGSTIRTTVLILNTDEGCACFNAPFNRFKGAAGCCHYTREVHSITQQEHKTKLFSDASCVNMIKV